MLFGQDNKSVIGLHVYMYLRTLCGMVMYAS